MKNGFYKCYITIQLIETKKLILIKITTVKNVWFWFFNHGLESEDSVCNGHHDLKMSCVNISDIAIVIVTGVDYRCIIHDINNSEVIHLLENFVLGDRGYL